MNTEKEDKAEKAKGKVLLVTGYWLCFSQITQINAENAKGRRIDSYCVVKSQITSTK